MQSLGLKPKTSTVAPDVACYIEYLLHDMKRCAGPSVIVVRIYLEFAFVCLDYNIKFDKDGYI